MTLTKSDKRIIENVKHEYAAYRGDEYLGIGTIEELAKLTSLSPSTLYHRSFPVGHKRVKENGIKLYKF